MAWLEWLLRPSRLLLLPVHAVVGEFSGVVLAIIVLLQSAPLAEAASIDDNISLVLIVTGVVCVLAFAFGGHKCIGCPPLWLLLLEGCCRRRFLAEKLCCQKHYFICECRHPAHQRDSVCMSAVHPSQSQDPLQAATCGWMFCTQQQPGAPELVDGGVLVRCKACAMHHDSYLAEVRAQQQEKFLERVVDRARKQVADQADAVHKEVRTQLTLNKEHHQCSLDDAVNSMKGTSERQLMYHKGLESRLQDHVADVKSELQDHAMEKDMAKERIDSLQKCISSQFSHHEMLGEQLQAHISNTQTALDIHQAESLKRRTSVAERYDGQEALLNRLSIQVEETQAQLAERKRMEAEESSHGINDASLRPVYDKLAASAEIHVAHTSLYEALEEYAEENIARMSTVQSEHGAAIQALMDELRSHARDTQCEFEAYEETHERDAAKFETSLSEMSSRHEAIEAQLYAHAMATHAEFAAHETVIERINQEQTLSLDTSHEVLRGYLQEHCKNAHDEYEEQQLTNQMMRERQASLETKESRLFAKHENLESSVRSFRKDVRKAHDRFESDHHAHFEAQSNMEMVFKAEQEAFAACDKNFATFKVLTADHFRKQDVLHQRAFAENAAASDKIGKHSLSFQRLYAELGIPMNTMPSSWGCSTATTPAQTPMRYSPSPAPSAAQTPLRSNTPSRLTPSPVLMGSR